MIAFRKAHPVFHQSAELKGNDRLACGHPDISFHGSRAWVPELEVYSRQLGVLYCGLYACHEDGTPDQYTYVAYNMHGDTHTFALPNLPRPLSWHLSMNTADGEGDVFYPEGKEIEITTQRQIEVPGHTVQILIGRPGTLNLKNITPAKKRNEKRNQKRNQKRANDELNSMFQMPANKGLQNLR
ncbi:MAG: alpha-amylase, partial [Clostridiales bacterium]|nr:alpha-amylase [Clostridiales bacterium]